MRIATTLLLALALLCPACSDTDDTSADAGPADSEQTCETLQLPEVDASRGQFSLSLFHFNIEYVIGGLDYTDASGKRHLFVDPKSAAGWDNDRVEDWIVSESFHPILAMYDKHPSWGVDIELQSYMVEVLAARHPQTLALLRKLANRGQVELISFHYAAQLFLAYPNEDHARSIAATKAVFAAHCLPLSGVVFNQEGQAGEGRQRALVQHGYEVGVHPKNLWNYVRSGEVPWPWYESEGGALIVGPGGVDPASGVQVGWDFFDDGELRAVTGKLNPYFAPLVGHEPARVKEFEDQLLAREQAGWHLGTIGDYTRHLAAKNIEKRPAPPLLDGTWQPKSTESIHRWLGGRSDTFSSAEEDNKVRSGNARARMHVAAAQVLFEHLQTAKQSVDGDAAAMADLWRLLWHAEVSDCSGVNPWRGEVMFGLDTNAEIEATAAELRDDWLKRLDYKHVQIDLKERTAEALPALPAAPELKEVAAPLPVTLTAQERSPTARWTEAIDDESGQKAEQQWQLDVDFGPPPAKPCGTCDPRHVAVAFPRLTETFSYSPGLIEDEVRAYALTDFSWQLGEVWLPLANGLIGIGDGWWVIKHVRQVHIAARVRPAVAQIDFVDRALQQPTAPKWRFTVFKGNAADALALANRINIHPLVRY